MEIDKENKTKTFLVIILFLIIILISAYVVIDKIIKRNKENMSFNTFNQTTNNFLINSNLITELSLNNNYINRIYNYIDDRDIEYLLYSNKNKELSWDIKSLMVSKYISRNSKDLEYIYIDKEEFEKEYFNIFGEDVNQLSIEQRTASLCGAASYDFENDIYVVKLNCELTNNMKTFYKNITFKDDKIMINKYYIFIDKYIINQDEKYSLYLNNKRDEKNLLVANIEEEEISDYISYMNIISFEYIKSKDGNYYFNTIK